MRTLEGGSTGLTVNLFLFWIQPYLRLLHPVNFSFARTYKSLFWQISFCGSLHKEAWLILSVSSHTGAVTASGMWMCSISGCTSGKDQRPEEAIFKVACGLGPGTKVGRTKRERLSSWAARRRRPKIERAGQRWRRRQPLHTTSKLDTRVHLYKAQSDAKGGSAFFIHPHTKVIFNPLKAVSLRICSTDLHIHSLHIIELVQRWIKYGRQLDTLKRI